jgi:hypothetical protein
MYDVDNLDVREKLAMPVLGDLLRVLDPCDSSDRYLQKCLLHRGPFRHQLGTQADVLRYVRRSTPMPFPGEPLAEMVSTYG